MQKTCHVLASRGARCSNVHSFQNDVYALGTPGGPPLLSSYLLGTGHVLLGTCGLEHARSVLVQTYLELLDTF